MIGMAGTTERPDSITAIISFLQAPLRSLQSAAPYLQQERKSMRVGAAGTMAAALALLTGAACHMLPSIGANGLLRPARRPLPAPARTLAPTVTLQGDGVALAGWRFPARGTRRGTVIYLHGVADNRGSSAGVAERFTPRGFDVIAYDSRAHGDSGGDICTYGYYEKRDLQRVLDVSGVRPVILIGSSLGAAVALQTAAEDPRIDGVVAAESFSDLRTIAGERAPGYFSTGSITRALALAESTGRFRVDDVSPARAARKISVPVLLLHGALDRETPPEHSRRIFAALASPRQLLIVDGAGHNESLHRAWAEVERWVEVVAAAR
jgi:pimeloyl-ACP methyl ester carboxylesterase